MMGWSSGTLQSSTRSGLVSARRWQSPHKLLGHVSELFLEQAPRIAGGNCASPTELMQSLIPAEAGALEDLDHHLDHFGIDHRRFRTDGLGADLEELAVAALLRTLAAEHGADVVELLHAGALVQTVSRYRRASPTRWPPDAA